MRVALPLLVAWTIGCATTRITPAAPPSPAAARWYDAVDLGRAGDEAVEALRAYLRVDTQNPPGNETRGAELLARALAREGIPSEIVEHAPGRGSLIARLPGSGDEGPLCLVSHIDVVPAEPATWAAARGPLSGALEDGYVWGRGALDMKGLGVLELQTLVWLKRLGVPLRRDVVLLAVAGEESDSGGMRHVVERHWAKVGCSHAINEGGFGIEGLLLPGQTVYAISVGEKGVLWVDVAAHGPPGHGSTPVPGRAPERLLRALDRLTRRSPSPVVHPALYELAARVGEDAGGLEGFVLKRPALVRALVLSKLLESPPARATLFDTVNVTGFRGRLEPNVVPSEVAATLDCRTLPGHRPADLLAELRDTVDDPGVTFQVLGIEDGSESPWDDPLFAALARHTVSGRKGVVAGPTLSPGFTDSLFLRKKGVRAYGLVPFEVPQAELLGYHGPNERVSVANVHRGLRTLFRVVLDVAAK